MAENSSNRTELRGTRDSGRSKSFGECCNFNVICSFDLSCACGVCNEPLESKDYPVVSANCHCSLFPSPCLEQILVLGLVKAALTNCQRYEGASRLLPLPGAWLAGVNTPCVLSGAASATENRPQVRPSLMSWEKSPLAWDCLGCGTPASSKHPELRVTAGCWASCDGLVPWLC